MSLNNRAKISLQTRLLLNNKKKMTGMKEEDIIKHSLINTTNEQLLWIKKIQEKNAYKKIIQI